MNWNNEITDLLKTKYPIVQAPMLGVTTPEMVAAISNAGGLGSLAVGGLSPAKAQELIRKTKALTSKPFAVNFFAHEIPDINRQDVQQMQDFLEKVAIGNNIPFEKQPVESFRFYHYTEQVEVFLEEGIPVLSFTFGIPGHKSIHAFKEKGIVLIGTATCVEEALMLQDKDIDIITAQGVEGGGHRGTFITGDPLPLTGLVSLVPEIMTNIDKPVLAAGGIYNGSTLQSALASGAKGVQIGTAFIASPESAAIPAYKAALRHAAETDIRLTRAFSGRWALGIYNKFMEIMDDANLEIPPYPIQNSLTTALRAAAQAQNNKDFTNLWAGLYASKAEAIPCAAIFEKIVRESEER